MLKEISRHYGLHHEDVVLDYNQCRAITRAAALAFAGQRKVAKAEEKDGNPKSVVSATAKTRRDQLWFPSAAQQAALAAVPAPPAPAPAASVPVPPASAPAVAVGSAAAPGAVPPAPVAPTAPTVAARHALPAANNPFLGVSAYNAHFNALGERIVWSDEEDEDEDNEDDDDDEENDDEDDENDEDEEMTG